MADIKSKTKRSDTDPDHPQKVAVDAYGGDPLNPNEAMLDRIAAVIDDGRKKDEAVERWAVAFQAVCPEPVQLLPTAPVEVYMKALPEVRPHLSSPFLHRHLLDKMAKAVLGDDKHEDAANAAVAIKALKIKP